MQINGENNQQWWNVTKYIYSSGVLDYSFEVLWVLLFCYILNVDFYM